MDFSTIENECGSRMRFTLSCKERGLFKVGSVEHISLGSTESYKTQNIFIMI